MRFSINRSYFADKLATVVHAIPSVSPTIALTGVLIQVFPDYIVLTGSDSNLAIQVVISPDEKNQLVIEERGSIIIRCSALIELTRRMNGDILHVESIDDTLIRFNGPSDSKFELFGRAPSEYPDPNLTQPAKHLTLPIHALQDISRQVAFAAATNSPRVYLNGVNLRINDHKLIATATNTLAMARKIVPVQTDASAQANIPVKAISLVASLFGSEGECDVYLDRQRIQFVKDDLLLQTTLYDGVFPDCDRILQTHPTTHMILDTNEFEGMMSRSIIYTGAQTSDSSVIPVRMTYTPDQTFVEVLSSTLGSCRQNIEKMEMDGESGNIAFNASLMINGLRAIKDHEKFNLGLSGELKPLYITLPDDPSLELLFVAMRRNV